VVKIIDNLTTNQIDEIKNEIEKTRLSIWVNGKLGHIINQGLV